MNVQIELPANIETVLRRRAEAAGIDLERLVEQVLAQSVTEEDLGATQRTMSHADFMAKLHGIVDLHPDSNGTMDDSRDSIYDGRGE